MGNQTSNINGNETLSKLKTKATATLTPLSPKNKRKVQAKTTTPAAKPVTSNFDWLDCYTPTPQRPAPQQLPSDYKFNDFVFHQESVLGEGAFARVVLATHLPTRMKVAVKVITKKKIPAEMKDYVIREPGVLAQLHHKNIVKLYLVHEDANYIYMFLQYITGSDMHSRLERDGAIDEETAREWFKQIICSVEFSHKQGFCHRDLKLENLLIAGEGKKAKILLIDFGFAAYMESTFHLFTDFPGSVCYAAPELIKGTPYRGDSADIYSMGVILYTLLQSTYPFYSEDRREMVHMITSGTVQFDTKISESAQSLIRWMLAKQPENRPTLSQIKNHQWTKPQNVMMSPLKTTVGRLKETARASLSPASTRRRQSIF